MKELVRKNNSEKLEQEEKIRKQDIFVKRSVAYDWEDWLFRSGRATVSDKLEPLYPMFRAGYPQLGATQEVTPQYLYFEN